ncbi:endonuclease/exonuclease/phosphatase family protein [Alkalinema sp. FACHB-956]|uniref:endonuclease/exonuclease/phosphatase family protein n=1 Tax=Alkalinema sp. FACHB-956 TaxID=2692768 RepID=UPI00168A39D1|nr:endonuclease/exonuclease/phosphatase family protein [Alkalinema sp. FACHB-956]
MPLTQLFNVPTWLPSQRFCRQSTAIIDQPALLQPRSRKLQSNPSAASVSTSMDTASTDTASNTASLDEVSWVEPPALVGSSLRILNWNIAKNNHDLAWYRDFTTLLRTHRPHLVFLQEVRLCAQRRHLPALTELAWSFAPNFLDTYHQTYSGVLTAGVVQCTRRQSILTDHHEPIAKTPKVALCTEYAIAPSGDQPTHSRPDRLLTVNAHLINFVELKKFQAQLDTLEQRMADHDGLIVFSGDFNTWSRSRWHCLQRMTQRLGLTQAVFPSWDTGQIKRFLLSPPLDYVFYRGFHQTTTTAKVIGSITSSDHKPLLLELTC